MEFRVKPNGTPHAFIHHDGQDYRIGDLVSSHRRLDRMFPDRFEYIGPPQEGETAHASTPPPEVTSEPAQPVKNTLRAVPKGGGQFDVLDVATGKTVNTAPLTERQAKELVEGTPEPPNPDSAATTPDAPKPKRGGRKRKTVAA